MGDSIWVDDALESTVVQSPDGAVYVHTASGDILLLEEYRKRHTSR